MSLVPSKSPFHTHSSDWISATGKPVIQLAIWNIDMHLLPIKSISHMYLQVTLTMDPLLAMLGVAAFLYEAFFVYIRLHPDTSLKELIVCSIHTSRSDSLFNSAHPCQILTVSSVASSPTFRESIVSGSVGFYRASRRAATYA